MGGSRNHVLREGAILGQPKLPLHVIHGSLTHPSPHSKWHLDWFSWFCTAHSRNSLYFTISCPFPLTIDPLHGGSGFPSNTWFLWPTSQHPKWHHDQFSHFCRAHGRDRQTNKDQATPSVAISCIYVVL